MQTEWIKARDDGCGEGVRRAAAILRAGGLVGIPTETVYGLAANALDEKAVARIFTAKGRPQDNPLIVHVAGADWLEKYAVSVPKSAYTCIEAFWPGPLTLILPKNPVIPDLVSAGLSTAAFRFPSHPVAAAVIREAGVPLAAPSANLSGSPSPTTAAHVMADLGGRIEAVLDGGSCGVGVESTVLNLCSPVPTVLRPGGVTPEMLREVLGEVAVDKAVLDRLPEGARVASPGMKYKHYAPKTQVVILKGDFDKFAQFVNDKRGEGAAALCFEGEERLLAVPCIAYGTEHDGASQAHRLFDALRALDGLHAQTVYARCPDRDGVSLAVYNRLLRAAAFTVLEL